MKITYHYTLAKYFAAKSLYLNEGKKKNNTRKVVEQPYQQTIAEMWHEVIATFCDLLFIEVKCRAGLIF